MKKRLKHIEALSGVRFFAKSHSHGRCKFDENDPRPILGNLLRAKRATRRPKEVGIEVGVPPAAIVDVEGYRGAKIEELEAICTWLGVSMRDVQMPHPIVQRAYGRRKATKTHPSNGFLATRILDHLAQGFPLSAFEDYNAQISSHKARALAAKWMREDPEFRRKYEEAKEIGAYFIAEDTIGISDNEKLNPAIAKNKINTRQWMAAKYNPKFGKDANQHAEVNVNLDFASALEALERRQDGKQLPAPSRELQVIDINPEKVSEKA